MLEHSTTHWKSGICPYGSTSPSPIIERTDTGSTYFRHFFYGKEHQNWFGVDEALGPVALSIRRERVVGGGEGQAGPGGGHHNHHHHHHHDHHHQVEAKAGCRSTSCTGSLCAPASSYHSGRDKYYKITLKTFGHALQTLHADKNITGGQFLRIPSLP